MLKIRLKDLQNGYSSHNLLAKLSQECSNTSDNQIILDFRDVKFITANHFAIIGSILYNCSINKEAMAITFEHLSDKISHTAQVNGFSDHLGLPRKPDIYNTAIPYMIFHTDQIVEFEKYLTISLFSRNDLPLMSDDVKNAILDYILEIFNNVNEHANTDCVFSCGQYFPRKQLLFFTVSDIGKSIQKNVEEYFSLRNEQKPESCLEWALQSGHSTRKVSSPGGLGLSLISDFIEQNQGELYIVSGTETYEQTKRGKRYKTLDYYYYGTAVTIAFNLGDKSIYVLDHESFSNIF